MKITFISLILEIIVVVIVAGIMKDKINKQDLINIELKEIKYDY